MHVRRDSKNKVLSSVYARTRVRNHRECTYLFQHTYACVCALAEDIFALARSSAATTKNLPILGHRAGFNPIRVYNYRYPPSCSIVQDGSIFRYRCDRRWAAGFIGFPREMNFARSIVPNYAPCLATNYALPFISSSFVSFFSFSLSRY